MLHLKKYCINKTKKARVVKMNIVNIPFDGISGKIFRGNIPRNLDLNIEQNQISLENQLNDERINVIVVLCSELECKNASKIDMMQFYRDKNFEVIHFPIQDYGVPEEKDLIELVDRINDYALKGLNILIHCRAGIGRTGLVLACLKRKIENYDAFEAINAVRTKIPGAVETEEQRKFVAQFPPVDEEYLKSLPKPKPFDDDFSGKTYAPVKVRAKQRKRCCCVIS